MTLIDTDPISRGHNGTAAVVERVRQRLVQLVWLRALLVGVAVGVGTWLVALALLLMFAPSLSPVALLAAPIAAAITVWFLRARAGDITRTRAALWIEERFPALEFALVTLAGLEERNNQTLAPDALARLVAAVDKPSVAAPLTRSARGQLLIPAMIALLIVAAAAPIHALLVRARDVSPTSTPGRSTGRGAGVSDAGHALTSWRVRVVPPAYSALETQSLGDVGSVNALVGSTIEVTANDTQTPDAAIKSVTDSAHTVSVVVARSSTGWRTNITMPVSASEVRFTLGAAARQLLLEPRSDSLPVVRLKSPTRDSVYRVAQGAVTLDAEAHDDFGLASTTFELIVTSGEGERFTAKTVAVAPQRMNGEREHSWHATLSLDTMKLEAGDIVHMRAVARDRYPDAARELGASETRTFRIARPSEYDSVAVEPAPPPEVQKSLMSQRMLLILTQKLEEKRPGLSRANLVSESRKLSVEQQRLRKMVGDIVFQRLEGEDGAGTQHTVGDDQGKLTAAAAGGGTGGPPTTEEEGDESPIIAVNKPLLEAYNAMWDAGSALDIADTKAAIPHMKAALAAIERARAAERIYLRGKPPVVIIDVAKVRLAGKDTGFVNARVAREALSPREAARESRLLSAALLMTTDAVAARDSLAVLRLESLTDAPRLAAALGDALEVVRRGGDVTDALVRARRVLNSRAPADSLGHWRGAP